MTADELIALLRAANIRVPPSGLLHAAQLRKFLDVSDRTLQSWRAHGKPPSGVRLNGQWHYSTIAVAQFDTCRRFLRYAYLRVADSG
jgi:hypothetical protein